MTNRDLFDAIGMLDAAECKKALIPPERKSHGKGFRMAAAVSAAAVLALTAGASVWMIGRLKEENQYLTVPAASGDSEAAVQIEPQVRTVPFDDISEDQICFMSAAYAPYALTVSAEEQQALAAALEQSQWTETDSPADEPDGECDLMYVYNDGEPFRLTQYGGGIVKIEQHRAFRYYRVDGAACGAISRAANPEDIDTASGNLTWCAPVTISTEKIWDNFVTDAPECDMTTKDGVYYKMSNTCDYFDRASGEVRVIERREADFVPEFQNGDWVPDLAKAHVNSSSEDALFSENDSQNRWCNITLSRFQTDLRTAFSSEHTDFFVCQYDADRLLTDDLPGYREMESAEYHEPELRYDIVPENGTYRKIRSSQHRYVSQPVTRDEQHWYEDGMEFRRTRQTVTNCENADAAISPYQFALYYLYDFDNWEITGNQTVNGRECVCIEGDLTGAAAQKQQTERFEICADLQTGILMKFVGYDSAGQISRAIVTHDLQLDEAAEAVDMPDLAHMKESDEE